MLVISIGVSYWIANYSGQKWETDTKKNTPRKPQFQICRQRAPMSHPTLLLKIAPNQHRMIFSELFKSSRETRRPLPRPSILSSLPFAWLSLRFVTFFHSIFLLHEINRAPSTSILLAAFPFVWFHVLQLRELSLPVSNSNHYSLSKLTDENCQNCRLLVAQLIICNALMMLLVAFKNLVKILVNE